MNCASSERAENSKGFDCRNMGEVLSKECVKDEPSFAHSSEDSSKEVGAVRESESDKEVLVDLEEDISWLLSFNTDELSVNKCKCEGCLRRNETCNSEKKNAKLLLTSWKEFQSYLRNVYVNTPVEPVQSEIIPIEENERLHEIIQVMRLCDPYQLFQKIEDEVKTVVLQTRNCQLSLLKNESNPTLAKEFITGLIERYVKLITSAQQLSSAIDLLLGPQFQRFGLTWYMLNKHLYQSLVYAHKDVQQNLVRFKAQIKMCALNDKVYQELFYDLLSIEDEMLTIAAAWKKIEPLIEDYRNSKAREVETLNDLQDILKSFFANRPNAVNGCGNVDSSSEMENDKASQYCLNCLTRRGCPCDECTVTHMLSCEGMDSPSSPDSPLYRSRSPLKEKDVDNKEEIFGEKEQSCECHACTVPPPELMDCSVTFNQLSGKNNHGEGFQLYPHIHGTVTDNLYETENFSSIYSNLQATSDSVYPHLYNLHNQTNSIANVPKINISGNVPNRTQLVQPVTANKVQPQPPVSTSQEKKQLLTTTTAGNKLPICGPTLPPPPPNTPTKPLPTKVQKITTPDTQKKPVPAKPVPLTESKPVNTDAKKIVPPKEKDVVSKPAAERPTPQQSSKPAAACIKSSLCGEACTLKNAGNSLKTPCCGKKAEKRRAAIARLGLARTTNSRSAIKCPPGKENEHTHKPGKSHSCGKLKPHDISKKIANGKMNGQEPDDSSSQEDTCSERSNSVSTQKDSRHCDCCYCEVFGHNGPSAAPVSRNYQEMRERLRIRLNMKKSAKCKAGQGQVGDNKTTPGASKPQGNTANDGKQKVVGEKDLESLLKFIEGKTREECKDPKRIAKRARQKKRKLEEKERMMEEEADRKRLEAMKKQVTISVVNDNNKKGKQNQAQQPSKQQQQQQLQPKIANKQNNNNNRNNNTNTSNTNQPRNSQTLNLSGLKSLVEKPDPNSGPKMVTIRRVTAPFSAEPTVTITLKGSTPDKDKVLFMLKNGSEAYQPEEKETTKRKRKRKKAKKEPEYYEEEEDEEPETYYEEPEPEPEKTGKRKRRRNRKKNAEVGTVSMVTTSRNNKKESSKTVEIKNAKNSKTNAQSQPERSKPSVKQSSSQMSNSKAKNVPVLKAQSEKSKELNSKSKKDKSSNDSSSNSKNSVKSANVTKNSRSNEKQSVSVQKTQVQTKQLKNVKVQVANPVQVKGKETKTVQKTLGKNNIQSIQKVQPKQEVKQTVLRQQQLQQQESAKKSKNCQRTIPENDMSSRFGMGGAGGYDRGKVVINTPSYRLSEVLSSIAPSPPPKEEINLENLRLPPGITITKIEGPITKSIRASEQPLHVSKPVPVTPPIVVSTPTLKQSHPPPPGNVIVVDTGRLKEVIKENSPNPMPAQTSSGKRKKKKKKNKQNAENAVPTMELPMTQANKFGLKLPKNNPLMGKSGVTVISADEARKMVPNLENQQATIIKTSDNMVTIRSPAFQQAMNMQAYHNSPSFRPGINGYNNVSLFQNDMNRISDSIGKLKLNPEDKLARQMRNLNIKEGSRASQIFAQAMAAAGQNGRQETTTTTKKKKKKRKSGTKGSDEKEVEPVESVFQPKDIDLENGDIDDDERELEAFKRFCLQSVPSERKNKVKVNLNIKDIVLKKKSSAIGCS